MSLCHYHPDRIGVGVCMRCRVVICTECCTRVDGVNHCHACLKVLGQRQERPRAASFVPQLRAAVFLFLAWVFFFVIAWSLRAALAP